MLAIATLAFAAVIVGFPPLAAAQDTDAAREHLSIAPEGPWIETRPWNEPSRSQSEAARSRYLLVDRQLNLPSQSYYTRTVRSLDNESSVQDSGSLSFTFDPSFQDLVLHRILIHRDGETIDQLSMDRVRLIQPESELPLGIYNGEHKALLILDDLRVGDILEVASSTVGMNPVLGDEFASVFICGYSVPVHSMFLRITLPSEKAISWRNHRHESAPVRNEANGLVDLTWRMPHRKAIEYEDSVPHDVIQTPFIEVSTFPDWQSVARWTNKLYPRGRTSPEMQEQIRKWRRDFESREEQASAAIRFVQDEVRYFGIEVGPDSFRPSKSAATFERRYGDCKAKTRLLCDLLDELGIDAWPALVRSPTAEFSNRLPSPFLFNHVIAQFEINGQKHWVDATRTLQRGPLDELPVGRFETALELSENSRELTNVTPPELHDAMLEVMQQFRVVSFDEPVVMTVESIYRGANAENMRSQFADTTIASLEKDYLNYYAEQYPSIRDPDLSFDDDQENNVFTMYERYQIDKFFTADDFGRLYAYCVPETVQDWLTVPSTRLRSHPVRISHPSKASHTTVFHIPEEWPEWSESESLAHEAFRFDWTGRCNGRKVTHKYTFETLADRVPAKDVEAYLAKLDEVDTFLGDYIEQPKVFGLSSVNWMLLTMAVMYTVIVSAFAIWMVQRKDRPPGEGEPFTAELVHLEPQIGGWLILVGIGVFVTPVELLYYFAIDFTTNFDIEAWQEAVTPGGLAYHPGLAPLWITELLVQLALIVASLVQLYLFATQRRGFPKLYIGFALCVLALAMLRLVLFSTLPDISGMTADEATTLVAQALLTCLIWVPYMLVSQRVKATFVR